jgi:tRNA A-37 threonylcarbamoyl transferase component Bud32
MMKPIFALMGLGGAELLILLGVALLGMGLLTAGALFMVWRSRHKKQAATPLQQPASPPPPIIPKTVSLPKCPQCRQPLPENAPEGLCPACLAKVALGSEPAPPGPTININPLAQAAPGTRVAPDPAQLAAQFPQLEIIELLGMGGMGMVYKARQPRLDRIVALKILPVESHQHPSFAERFGREAKALAKLNHPGIVNIYDFGQTSQYYYFVMEYVDGMNLRHLLHNQPLEPRQALELVTQICTALQFAHDEGVVHRDIKPENILLNKKGQVKIADFGLAKLLGTAPDTALTMSQASMGTMNYMAPEQRLNAQAVDHRADIYSLGVVFYEMLTGEVPMGRFEAPSKRVQVDVRLDEAVLRALEREPARRYQQAGEVKTDVESITEGHGRAQAKAEHQLPESEWQVIAAGAGKVLALSAAIGLTMWTLHTAWPLLVLLLGSLGFGRKAGPQERRWVNVVWVLSVSGLCGYGVWMSKSAWPLVALFSLFNWGHDDEEEEGSEKDRTSPADETPPHKAEPPAATPISSPPRLSRTAVAGAACMMLVIGVVMYATVFDLYPMPQEHREVSSSVDANGFVFARRDVMEPGPPTSWRVAVLTSSILGVAGLLGMMVCGWVAAAQIRRLAGTLYGLGLALFEWLLVPLILIDGAVGVFLAGVVGFSRFSPNMAGFYWGVGALICVVLDFFIVRKLWRIYRR